MNQTHHRKLAFLGLALGLAAPVASHAATVTLNASDTINNSSFNAAGGWSDASAPHGGGDYLVNNGIRLRTPANGSSHAFAGDSLTLGPSGTTGYGLPGGELMYKGTGNTGTITINSLILNGGSIAHANGVGDIFNLAGNISVLANSTIYTKQGQINLLANLSGAGTITNPGSDGVGSRNLTLSASANTFTGNLVIGQTAFAGAANARLELAQNANLNFVIGANGINNSVSGLGGATFNGLFNFDLSGASTSLGDSWSIATVATKSFGGTFGVNGFTDAGGDTWQRNANGVTYLFDEGNGMLTVVPEPSTFALMGLSGLALVLRRRLA